MAVTAIDPTRRGATPALTDFQRLRDHRICGSYPLNEDGFDAVHTRLSEAYALLALLDNACTEGKGDAFETLNSEIQGRAINGIQRLIAEADFEAELMHGSAKGGTRG